MFSLSVLLLAASSVSALVIPRDAPPAPASPSPPAGWIAAILEPYPQYHARYLALGCENEHSNATFFNECCHPLKVGETVEKNRPASCVPTAAELASASAALPTSTVVPIVNVGNDDNDDDDEDCDDGDDDDDVTTTSSSSSAKATPTPPPAPKNDAPPPPAPTTSATTPPKNDAPSPPKSDAPSQSPTDTPTATPKATSTTQAAPEKTPSSGSSLNTNGVATFFYQDGVAGACGKVHSDNDFVAAIDSQRYGDLGAVSPLCGQSVKITNTENEKSVTVVIADACPTCDNSNSIDLSTGAFLQIATEEEGQVNIVWSFV